MLFKKAISILSVVAMLSIIFVACAPKGSNQIETTKSTSSVSQASTNEKSDATGGLPIVNKPITLKYWIALDPEAVKYIQNDSENLAYQELEKRTGIHIEFTHPNIDQIQEQYNLLLASGDLPDIMCLDSLSVPYPGGPDKAISDGVFLKLNDYMKYAPNYQALREEYGDVKKMTVTDSGNIWGFFTVMPEPQPAYRGLVVRKDWLDELNLPMPSTVDEWYTTLKAFKEKKNAVSSYFLDKSGIEKMGLFMSAFGGVDGFFQVDGKVKFGALEPGYKNYIETMAKWYNDGLIDKNFATGLDVNAYVTSSKTGALQAGFWNIDPWKGQAKDAGFNMVPAPYPGLNKGDVVHYRQTNFPIFGNGFVITKANKYPVETVKWFDYQYSEEGSMLDGYGIEGKTYNMVDGKPQFTDMMLKNEKGMSVVEAIKVYAMITGPFKLNWRRDYTDLSEAALSTTDVWSAKDGSTYVIPPLSLTEDEGKEFPSIMNDINTLVSEKVVKFIMGVEPISNYDAFVNQIKSMKIDRALAIEQAALDRYNARK